MFKRLKQLLRIKISHNGYWYEFHYKGWSGSYGWKNCDDVYWVFENTHHKSLDNLHFFSALDQIDFLENSKCSTCNGSGNIRVPVYDLNIGDFCFYDNQGEVFTHEFKACPDCNGKGIVDEKDIDHTTVN